MMIPFRDVVGDWSGAMAPAFFVRVSPASPTLVPALQDALQGLPAGAGPVSIHAHSSEWVTLIRSILKVYRDGTWYLDVPHVSEVMASIASVLESLDPTTGVWFGLAGEDRWLFRDRSGLWEPTQGYDWKAGAFPELRRAVTEQGGWEQHFRRSLAMAGGLLNPTAGPWSAYEPTEPPMELGDYLFQRNSQR